MRIESTAQVAEGVLRSLDLLDDKVRDAIAKFKGGQVTALYESDLASDYL